MREARLKLESLQKIDEAILDIIEETNGLSGKLTGYAAAVEKIKKEEEEALQRLKQLEASKGDMDKMLFIEQERMKKFRTRLQGQSVKSQQAFSANQKEVDKSKKDVETIEGNILKVMQDMESLRAGIEAIKAKLGEAEKTLEASKGESEKRNVELAETLKDRKIEREKLAAEIPRNILSVYTRILTKYPRNPVATALNEFCLGCHMHIPPQLYNELKRADKLITCPSCRRVLFYKDPAEEPAAKAAEG